MIAVQHRLLTFGVLLLYISTDETRAQPLKTAQQYLRDLVGGDRLQSLPYSAESSLVSDLLAVIPTEPVQFAGQCSVTYDATAYEENRHAVLLPPVCTSDDARLPDADSIWQELLVRNEFLPEPTGINFLLVSFANWFLDDLFQTQHETNGTFLSANSTQLLFGQLYGRSPDRATALRSFSQGKMKTTIVNGAEYPPLLSQVQQDFPDFVMNIPANLQIDTTRNASSTQGFYALGDPRFNLHLGHLHWSTQFLRLHNRLCDMLLQNDPSLTDEQVYETSRLINFHFLLKLVTQDYIGNTISNFRSQAGITYDPDVMRSLQYPTLQNFIYFELNHLYRWHSMIPDQLDLLGGTSFPDVVFQPQLLTQAPLEDITQAFINTTAGALAALNTPEYMYPITRQTILDSRAQHLQGFNAYRTVFGLQPFTRFEDFGLSPNLTASLQALYNNDIDSVDWFLGVLIEQPHLENTFLGEAMYVSVATFALSAILNSDLIKNPYLWSDERMTPAGKAFVQANDMATFLQLDLVNPFFTPDKQPSYHTVDAAYQWSFRNLEKFVGLDFALDPFFDGSDYFFVLFYVALVAAAVIIVAFCLVSFFWYAMQSKCRYSELNADAQLIVCIHSAFALILGAQLVPYTVFVLPVWFGPNALDQLQQHYVVPFTCVLMHGVLYVLEGCVRASVRVSQLLLWHHLLWFVMIFIAAFKKDVFAIKLDFILDYFVCWEFALYVFLVAHRLQFSLSIQKVVLTLAGITYGASRVVQAAIVLGLFILSGNRMKSQPAIYWVMLLLSVVLVVLQTYTGYIYWAMWQRSRSNKQRRRLPLSRTENGVIAQ